MNRFGAGPARAAWLLLVPCFIFSCDRPGPAPAETPPEDSWVGCSGQTTPIAEVQGEGVFSPLTGNQVTVRGVVTFQDPGTGLYLESTEPDNSSRSSEALFIASEDLSSAYPVGARVLLSGIVAELDHAKNGGSDTQTALRAIKAHQQCGSAASIPETTIRLPLPVQQRESIENMRVILDQPLTVTDVYGVSRGEMTMSANGVLASPTEVTRPGPKAREMARTNEGQSLRVRWRGARFPVTGGSDVRPGAGVIGIDRRGKQLIVDGIPQLSVPTPDALQPPADNVLRIVTVNLHNYFNGDGRGAGFPAPRGARNPKELARQNRWISAAVHRMSTHLLAVQEIENDGFGKLSAAQSLSDVLSESGQSWTAINPGTGRIGDDAITVGLFYQPGRLEPAADAEVLSGPAFDGLSRPPLAQLFRDVLMGETFLIIVNHMKSKGGCPEGKTGSRSNTDLNDGQGCWNGARVAAARAVAAWSLELADRYGEPNILITGDMNAYRQENPIQSFRNAGFTELVEEKNEPPFFSFSYFGRHGTLDYAFASEELREKVNAAQIWHVNAPWPPGMALPETWLRFSDHDPVIVDLLFSQSATSD